MDVLQTHKQRDRQTTGKNAQLGTTQKNMKTKAVTMSTENEHILHDKQGGINKFMNCKLCCVGG